MEKKAVVRSTVENLSLGTVFKCGDPKCLESESNGKGNDIHFNTREELDKHVAQVHKKVYATGGTICPVCKEWYEFGHKFIKVKKKDAKNDDDHEWVFNHDRPTVQAVEMKIAIHPKCRKAYKEAIGDVI